MLRALLASPGKKGELRGVFTRHSVHGMMTKAHHERHKMLCMELGHWALHVFQERCTMPCLSTSC